MRSCLLPLDIPPPPSLLLPLPVSLLYTHTVLRLQGRAGAGAGECLDARVVAGEVINQRANRAVGDERRGVARVCSQGLQRRGRREARLRDAACPISTG
jgi:hypothetical protein